MIYIDFEKKNNKFISFHIHGHAGYDEYGKDIVCSAVSAISITIVNGITEVLGINAPYEMNDGFLSLDLKGLSDEEIDKCSVLMKTIFLGFKSMYVNYSEYIKITIKEV
jgi:uncharacterized protein YsxB (DUF464 family)